MATGGIQMTYITVAKRLSKRLPMFVKARLKAQNSEREVYVRNLSVDGALLEGPDSPEVFEIISLECGSSLVNGIVAWAKDGHIGVEFSEPITGETLVQAINSKLRVSAPKTYRPKALN